MDVKTFFKDVAYLLDLPDDTSTESNNVPLNEPDCRTNVIYLTTKCNLDCDYCYEYEKRHSPGFKHVKCTTAEIDKFIQDIEYRENGVNSTVVIMGGEPFLEIELINYTIDKIINSKKPGGFGINIITNGLILHKPGVIPLLLEWFEKIRNASNCGFIFEVSYDGSGQDRRCFPNGQSSKDVVEGALDLLDSHNIPYKISYTCHANNYQTIVRDIIYIIHRFKKCTAINIGYAFYDIDKELGDGGSIRFRDNFKSIGEKLFRKFKMPLCGVTCDICGKCNTSAQTGNAYLSPDNTILYKDKYTETKFDQFK